MALSPSTRKFLERNKLQRQRQQPTQFQRPQRFLTQPVQHINMFQKGDQPDSMSSSMDLLFGGEGERLIGNTQAIFPQLNTSDVGDIISSVQSEMFSDDQPQQRFRRRR